MSRGHRIRPQNPRIDRHGIGAGLIGLLDCGQRWPTDLVSGRQAGSSDSTPVFRTRGLAHQCTTTLGVYSGRREWPVWERTAPLSMALFFEITAYAAATNVMAGNNGGGASTGPNFTDRFGTGARRYFVGGVNIDPGGSWPLNQPNVAIITMSAAGAVAAYLNGVSEGTGTGATGPTYATFDRVIIGDSPDNGELTGFGYYLALWDRVLTAREARQLADDPFCIYDDPRPHWFYDVAAAGNNQPPRSMHQFRMRQAA